jgi:DNA invertase Pin-like site-specific DNA recombinase
MRKVAIYARVSTEHEAQLAALENQIQYYDEQFKKHPDWILVEKYIDEGITGTSTKKRKSFMRMMEDAKRGKFDLIVTREVSRFARNTVDTLQETRNLKKLGVEVYFTEDNIWTFKDEDGELKLSLMATLAQNESKKTSLRVKAGMQISFENGIFYGTGNILGYNKIDKNKMVIDEEQAEIVRYIFREYINGKGTTAIARELERKGYETSTGLHNWDASYLTGVLRNPFYCGTIIYRKQCVLDYLEQKRVKNIGQVEKVIIEGRHEPIISKEDFEKAQMILDSHSKPIKAGMRQARGVPKNIWSKKLVCECGSAFNRRVYHRNKDSITYAYICYNKKLHPKGKIYSYDYVPCEMKDVQEWKLLYMAEAVFKGLIQNEDNREELTKILLEGSKIDELEDKNIKKEIDRLSKLVENENAKLDKTLDMYLDEIVDLESFERFQKMTEERIERFKMDIEEYEKKLARLEPIEIRRENARKSVRKLLDINYNGIDEKLIDEIVEKIIVHKDYFEWKLNFMDETIKLKIEGKGKEDCFITEYKTTKK